MLDVTLGLIAGVLAGKAWIGRRGPVSESAPNTSLERTRER
jgi:hypothetical protein